jgi:phospholipid-translocating ATPase
MKILSLAHMCVVETFTDKEGKISKFYNGPSPDEVALVDYASSMKFDCTLSVTESIKLNTSYDNGSIIEYDFEVYRKMDFNSDRKRMSVLLKDPIDGKIKLLIKGADSIIIDRLDK